MFRGFVDHERKRENLNGVLPRDVNRRVVSNVGTHLNRLQVGSPESAPISTDAVRRLCARRLISSQEWLRSLRSSARKAFAESAVNQLVSRRMGKQQQVYWTKRSAHLLLQVRTQVMNGHLRGTLQRWYPGIKAESEDPIQRGA